jgi:hypothetical protein
VRAKLTFANVTSLLALFIALGGAGYAAGVVPFASRAGFADNAGKVDHLTAARSPKPGQLLALDHAGRFPAAAIPPPGVVERVGHGKWFAAAYCLQGEIVTGGGGKTDTGVVVASGPHHGTRGNLVGWSVRASDSGAPTTAEVLCARTAH